MAGLRGKGSFRRTVFLAAVLLMFGTMMSAPLQAAEVKGYLLVGVTVDIGLKEMLAAKTGELSEKELEGISVLVTKRYHERGYTTSYADRLVLRKDGIVEVHVLESKIAGIKISGVEETEAAVMRKLLVPEERELYNRDLIRLRAEVARKNHRLKSLRITPVNYKDSADVFLSVEAKKKSRGQLYGGLGVEPIYGFTPQLGYFYPFEKIGVDVYGEAGYREGKWRKLKGDVRFYYFPGQGEDLALYLGGYSQRLIERWQTYEEDYTALSGAPMAGVKISLGRKTLLNLCLSEIITSLENYDSIAEEQEKRKTRDYDSRFTSELFYSDGDSLVDKRDATRLKVALSGGRSDLNRKGYGIATLDFKTSLEAFSWLRFVPRLHGYSTTSQERFHWSYVFDRNLMGFFDDFTASRLKGVAGLDAEFEVSPEVFYAGPFVNSGYFLDERKEGKGKTGTGVKGKLYFRRVVVDIYFAWDASKGPSSGGTYVMAESSF